MQLNWEDFNEMSYTGICNLPGIGKRVAERIIEMQPFSSKSDLFKVKGLGTYALRKLGIEREKKEKKSWYLMPDGIEYPLYSLAKNTATGQIDFFWRVPKDKREYLK